MLDSIINAFNTIKLENAQKMSQSLNGINDETSFLDDNYITSEIKYLRSAVNDIQRQTNINRPDQIKTIVELNEQIAILAANNINALETAKSILHTTKSDFEMCVDAMILETHGDHKSAILKFDEFWRSHDYMYDNYMAPKIYATLLLDHTNRLLTAINCLSISLQLRPSDIQTRQLFKEALIKAGELTNAEIQESILKVLI